jgi:N-methylhydantoinase A
MTDEIRLGADVGGTFTDVVVLCSDGTTIPKKVLSSPPEFNRAVKQGIAEVLEENGLDPSTVREYTHGATVATNAILTRTGARTGLITTTGFRDVLEIRRMRLPRLYNINWEKPPPLAPRNLRLEVPARMNPWGQEVVPLDETAAAEAIARLIAEGVDAIAICYLHAYANGAHEKRTRDLVLDRSPGMYVSLSSEVLPEIKEYERTSTTVTNAYVQPVVSSYFESMEADLRELGITVPMMVMQSSGGMMPAESARQLPVHIIESGPAAGVTGVHSLAGRMGIKDAISLDMGGTTAKAAIIEDGEISRSAEYEVGGELSIGHRLMSGGGYLLGVPSIDIAEVGAGGGSIAWVDGAGALKVGPRSAGALPGPACYDQGGTDATITDANVHLGLTNPEYLAGGTLRIAAELADKAIDDRLAKRLGLDVTRTAWAIRAVGNSSLIRALRSVSTERGRDPRRFVLFAFGGMGPVQALDLASELGITRVVVPPLPGLFSALSLLFAEVEHHQSRSHSASTAALDCDRFNCVADELQAEAAEVLESEGYPEKRQTIELSADLHYLGQDHALTIPLRKRAIDPTGVARLLKDFHQEHARTYGYRSDEEEVRISALRSVARGHSETSRVPEQLQISATKGWAPCPSRRCYFGPEHGWVETDIIRRDDLAGGPISGPAIVEEDNSLTVILPGWRASLDEWSNIVLTGRIA